MQAVCFRQNEVILATAQLQANLLQRVPRFPSLSPVRQQLNSILWFLERT
jgi:hypothetical protein